MPSAGALGVVRAASLGRLDDLEVALLREIGDRASLALEIVRLRAVAEHETRRRHLLDEDAAGQAALDDLGRRALVGLDYADLVVDAVKLVGEHVRIDVVHLLETAPESDFLTLKASTGHGVSDHELTSTEPTSSPASFAFASRESVVSDDLRNEERFEVPELWSAAGLVSVMEVPIPGPDMPAGVIGVGRRHFSPFSEEESGFVTAVADVLASAAARSRAETAIRAQAGRDPLTGLPNRFLLADHSIGSSGPPGSFTPMSGADRTVLVIDIDRFKEINDTLGHAIGDLVLLEVSRRLADFGDPVELVARLGSDEFAVVARRTGGAEGDDRFAGRLLVCPRRAVRRRGGQASPAGEHRHRAGRCRPRRRSCRRPGSP